MRIVASFTTIMLFLVLISCSEENQGIKPQYRDVTEAVYSTVIVQPRVAYKVYPQVGGIIEELFVEEGDSVKNGDLLLKISDSRSSVNVQSAKLRYEIAKDSYTGESTMLNEMENQIKSARETVKNDSINYERQKRLWQQDVGSKMDFDNRKLAYEISKNELDRLLTAFHRSQKELKKQAEIASNTVKLNQINREDYFLKSKMDGLVYSIEKEVGESVSTQTPIAVIGSKSDFILSLLIDEVDIRKVYEGQTVIVSLDAYPNTTYKAKVAKIYPEKDERSLTFTIEAELITRPDRLLKGLSGEANIIINQKKNVLTLPSQFISKDKKVNSEKGLVSVETGLKSLEYTEILSGIDSSSIIKILK